MLFRKQYCQARQQFLIINKTFFIFVYFNIQSAIIILLFYSFQNQIIDNQFVIISNRLVTL